MTLALCPNPTLTWHRPELDAITRSGSVDGLGSSGRTVETRRRRAGRRPAREQVSRRRWLPGFLPPNRGAWSWAPAAAGELAHRPPGAPGWGLGPNLTAPAAAAPAPPPPPFLPSFLPSFASSFHFPRGPRGRRARGGEGAPRGGAAPGDPGVRASGRLAPGGGGAAAAPDPGHVRPLAPPRAAASPGSPALPEPRSPLHSAPLPSLNKHRGSLAASFCLHTRAGRGPCQNKSSPISLDSSPNPAPPASQWSDSVRRPTG
ncbi:hypothetical protein A6R68_10393 [Neotoma lepida]|uniref:Uncharacterized protein n=1 Tax=Neotoma lepida TaxID=56216 RepID=A0A1A6FX90_NEOLE|nr:hypothetical protein A6R68_10393 [Neotoma lepida]